MSSQPKLEIIWERVVDEVKQTVIRPTLWRSLEIAVPIAAENGEFVVGFPPGSFHMSGNLLTADHKNAIEVALQRLTGVRLTLRIIEGDSIEDWEHVKFKDHHLQALRDSERDKREREREATQTWDNLIEQLGRMYAKTPLRQLPQSRARYIREAIQVISQTMDDLIPDESDVDELMERTLGRVIERVGQLADCPSPMIALELHRYRGKF